MRYVVGAIELVCAILLVIPHRQSRFLGAATLVLVLTGAVTTHLIDDGPVYEEVSTPLHLVIMLCVVIANWPTTVRELVRWGPRELRSHDHGPDKSNRVARRQTPTQIQDAPAAAIKPTIEQNYAH